MTKSLQPRFLNNRIYPGLRSVPTTRDQTLQPPWKIYFMILERRVRLLVEPWIQEWHSGFHSGSGAMETALYPCEDTGVGMFGEFAHVWGVCQTSPNVFSGSKEGL